MTLDVLSTCDMFLCDNMGGGSRLLLPFWGLGGGRTLNPKTKFDGGGGGDEMGPSLSQWETQTLNRSHFG